MSHQHESCSSVLSLLIRMLADSRARWLAVSLPACLAQWPEAWPKHPNPRSPEERRLPDQLRAKGLGVTCDRW
jgi:hypothetical protein